MNWEAYNNDKQSQFTSTGEKLLFHPEAVADLRAGRNHPIVLHIMPTERCNLSCVFCSVADRGENGKYFPDLEMYQIRHVVEALIPRGLKACILSGGGEPTLYTDIDSLIFYLNRCGMQIGLITNGIPLRKLSDYAIKMLSWIRISANTYDYIDEIRIPTLDPDTVLGFSYIWNEKTTTPILNRISAEAIKHKAAYIRLLPDCNLPTGILEEHHQQMNRLAERMGPPWFHQYKTHRQPAECHLGRVHPILYTDGRIYPCDSVVLNSPADDKRFHSEFALCQWDEVNSYFMRPVDGSLVNTQKCPHCVFAAQNDLLTRMVRNEELPETPACQPIHKDFI
jgi:MoaA/NifB/PqqE/SkfB family radical SAM enzyme